MADSSLPDTVSRYLAAARGDPVQALAIAVSDLIEVRAEAEFRAAALDQWVSRGYVQGVATEVLARAARAARAARSRRNRAT